MSAFNENDGVLYAVIEMKLLQKRLSGIGLLGSKAEMLLRIMADDELHGSIAEIANAIE
jgi:hypothetical protein